MALNLTTDQRALLRSPNLRLQLLTTWYMDSGVVRFSDDVRDVVYGGHTYIGASALASVTEIKSSNTGMSAEPIKLTIDGTRMYQAGFEDPAEFFRLILDEPLHNRRVDLAAAIAYHDSDDWGLVVPLFSGKINFAKLVDTQVSLQNVGEPTFSNLEVTIDSLAVRYTWATNRTRSHEDQLEIDPTDHFFSFTTNNIRNEQKLYWGKKAPSGSQYITDTQGRIIQFITRGAMNADRFNARR